MIDGLHRFRRGVPSLTRKTLCREHAYLIAPSKGRVIEARIARLELNVTSQAVAGRGDGDDTNQCARAVVDQVRRNDHARAEMGGVRGQGVCRDPRRRFRPARSSERVPLQLLGQERFPAFRIQLPIVIIQTRGSTPGVPAHRWQCVRTSTTVVWRVSANAERRSESGRRTCTEGRIGR